MSDQQEKEYEIEYQEDQHESENELEIEENDEDDGEFLYRVNQEMKNGRPRSLNKKYGRVATEFKVDQCNQSQTFIN